MKQAPSFNSWLSINAAINASSGRRRIFLSTSDPHIPSSLLPPPPHPPPRGPIPRIFTRGGSFFKKRGIVLFSNTFPTGGKGNLFSWPIFDWFIEIQLIYLKHSSSPYNLNIGFFFFFFFTVIVKQTQDLFYIYSRNFEFFFFFWIF